MSDYAPGCLSALHFHFQTDTLKNKDTDFKYVSPTEKEFVTRCEADSVSLIFQSNSLNFYDVFIEKKKGMIFTDYDFKSVLRLSSTLFSKLFLLIIVFPLGKKKKKSFKGPHQSLSLAPLAELAPSSTNVVIIWPCVYFNRSKTACLNPIHCHSCWNRV